jgi:hypothetical protein
MAGLGLCGFFRAFHERDGEAHPKGSFPAITENSDEMWSFDL